VAEQVVAFHSYTVEAQVEMVERELVLEGTVHTFEDQEDQVVASVAGSLMLEKDKHVFQTFQQNAAATKNYKIS
jgi:hypothetical protein